MKKILYILILLALGNTAFAASSFTVAIQTSTSSSCTFRITRTGNTSVAETIDWRVVSLSAIAGTHFTGYNGNYSGTVTFNVNDPYKDVTISESTPGDNAYKYQNGTSRSYRFEVLDRNGDTLASMDRSKSNGTSVPSSGLFSEKEITIYTSELQYSDAGYDKNTNNPQYINSSSYYNLSGIAPVAYYTLIGAQLRSTISLDAKEKNNGYQYIQVLINNTSTCDNRSKCDDGDPGNINLSRYMAGFDHQPSSTNTTYAAYTFPVTSQPNNCSTVTNAWSNGVDNKLYTQKFNTSCRATDGRLILPLDFTTLVVRFNASGGGTDNDEWYAKNVKAHIQAVDGTAPTVLNNNYKVSGGRHQKGNTVYVSVAFSEIVTVTGTPTLSTNWGTLSYTAGSGSNVLTFMGTIDPTDNNAFSVSGYSLNGGTIKDLAGNSFSGSISKEFGTSLDADYAWSEADFNSLSGSTYEIASKTDLRHLALLVNAAKNPCTGLTFQQMQDITCDNTYIPIGYCVSSSDKAQFLGTYDGQGHTISGITVSRTGSTNADGYVGVFGYVHYNSSTDYGTVKNVVLANSTFTGYDHVGGIAGISYGTVQNCRVESTVTINAGANQAVYHGGIVGDNSGNVIGCYSAAAVSANGKNNCKDYGGIVGGNFGGTVKDCLYAGTTVTAADKKGAIIGYSGGNNPTYSNNYYTAIDLGGVGAEGSSSDQNGARRARTVTLGTGVALSGTETAYNVSGLTAIGTTALRSGSTIYSGEGQTLTFSYTGDIPEGYNQTYSATAGTMDGNTLTMPAENVTVSATFPPIPWSGSGNSANDPYLIQYPSQLDLLATNVNAYNGYSGKYFALKNDITYTHTTAWNNSSSTENNYTAIGTNSSVFCGTFDGRNHTISGIRIYKGGNTDADCYLGLFGAIGSNGVVKGVTLADTRITGYYYVGGLAGKIYDATVEDCTVAANVCIHGGSSEYHGGIVGFNTNGTMQRCISRAILTVIDASSGDFFGAIVGKCGSSNDKVIDCLAIDATIPSFFYAGAIAGRDYGKFQRNFYRACTVAGTANATDVGLGPANLNGSRHDVTANQGAQALYSLTLPDGVTLVRSASATLPGTGNATYTTGADIDGTPYAYDGATLSLSYTGDAAAEGYSIALYVNGVQATDNGNGTYTATMPAADATVTVSTVVKDFTADGHSGESEADAYIIYNKDQLDLLAKMVNGTDGYAANTFSGKFLKLANDITYAHTSDWNDADSNENNYTPIGTSIGSVIKPFYGIFDGCGHIVSGIRVCLTNGYCGLFGRVRVGGTVKNLTLTDARITSKALRVGGIVGANEGNVQNCHVTSTVAIFAKNNNSDYYGGIVGNNDGSSSAIIDCTSAATINNNGCSECDRYGGIAGYNYGTVQNCLAVGVSVSSVNSYYGAIIGYNDRTLTANYYRACTVGDTANAVNVGVGSSEGAPADQAGARSVHALTLLAGATASGESVDIDATTYYAAGTTVTLSHGGAPAGYQEPFLGYSLNGADLGDNVNTFEMPAADATVTARWTVIDFTSGHAGTEADPYIIYNKDQLDLLASRVNGGTNYSGKFIKLGADIAYNPNNLDANEENYTSIGGYYEGTYPVFSGSFDGDGHTVSGIRINKTGSGAPDNRKGLFGAITNAVIKNLTVSDTRITANSYLGGIVGMNSGGTVENCHATNSVSIISSEGYRFGGIVGDNSDSGTIRGCTSAAIVSGGSTSAISGGIAGFNPSSSIIEHCLAIGTSVTVGGGGGQKRGGAIVGCNSSYDSGNYCAILNHNYYYGSTVTIGNKSYTNNIGAGNLANGTFNCTDVNSATILGNDYTDCAVLAITSTTKPAEIGAQIASYSNGLTVYEHGACYNGTYYLRHDLAGTAVGLTLTQGTKDGVSAWWGTYYNGTTNQTLVGATAYTLGTDFKLYRLGDDGRTVPKGVAVVIIAPSANASLVPAGTSDLSITDHATGGNQLQGSDSDVAVSGLTGTPHVLSISASAIGFRQFSGASIPAGKAYYVIVTP